MSLYGMMRTGVSGMNAQATRLATVADNIANSSTTGYKRSRAEFSTLVIPNSGSSYVSGGVKSAVQTAISSEGVLQYTTSSTDLAVSGNGFFIVQDASGSVFMTRSGNFVPDGEGRLVNAAGYQLLGYDAADGTPSATANGFAGLEPVIIRQTAFRATASTEGLFSANLPRDAQIVTAGNLPSDNSGTTSTFTAKSSLVAYDNLGGERMLDIYFTKTADNTWEVSIFDRAASTNGGFPYTGGALETIELTFDPANGQLASGSDTSISVAVPGGATLEIDLSGMSQLAEDYMLVDAGANGNPPSSIETIEIGQDGTLYAQYDDGTFRALYRVPLATVPSPDRLQVLPGNVYAQSADSGPVRVGFPNEGQLGSIVSGALESSNVDIATELTTMIESQRSYTANSKVFQTGSDLMDLLVNLKR